MSYRPSPGGIDAIYILAALLLAVVGAILCKLVELLSARVG